jgi:mono/diheme cytochrome c family protein
MGLLGRVLMPAFRIGRVAFLGTLVCLAMAPAYAAQSDRVSHGEALYKKYCAACHGDSGKGDGVVSGFMQPPPTNLTQLAKRHGGTFNDTEVMQLISGTKTPGAHGKSDMPVWGEILQQPSPSHPGARAHVQSKLLAITEYLRSIQEK